MSITIHQSPSGYASAHSELWHVVESTNKAVAGFQYVFDIYKAGNLVDLSSPGMGYTKGYANWQMGFVVGTLHGKRFTPELIPIDPKDGSFIYQGKRWG